MYKMFDIINNGLLFTVLLENISLVVSTDRQAKMWSSLFITLLVKKNIKENNYMNMKFQMIDTK